LTCVLLEHDGGPQSIHSDSHPLTSESTLHLPSSASPSSSMTPDSAADTPSASDSQSGPRRKELAKKWRSENGSAGLQSGQRASTRLVAQSSVEQATSSMSDPTPPPPTPSYANSPPLVHGGNLSFAYGATPAPVIMEPPELSPPSPIDERVAGPSTSPKRPLSDTFEKRPAEDVTAEPSDRKTKKQRTKKGESNESICRLPCRRFFPTI
jgi:hypothetical protein